MDSELLYAYARVNNLGEIDSFLHTSHQANLQSVGDRYGGAQQTAHRTTLQCMHSCCIWCSDCC